VALPGHPDCTLTVSLLSYVVSLPPIFFAFRLSERKIQLDSNTSSIDIPHILVFRSHPLHRDAHNLRDGSSGQPAPAGSRADPPAANEVAGNQTPATGLPGGPSSVAAAGGDAAFNHFGPAELSESIGLFIYGQSSSAERESFVCKARAGMKSQFVRGHTVSGSSLSTSAVVALIMCKWGSAGQDHASIEDLPAGLVDTVPRWVSFHR